MKKPRFKPICLSKARRSLHSECGPGFGVSILLRCLGTAQAYLTPSVVTERSTTSALSLLPDPLLLLGDLL